MPTWTPSSTRSSKRATRRRPDLRLVVHGQCERAGRRRIPGQFRVRRRPRASPGGGGPFPGGGARRPRAVRRRVRRPRPRSDVSRGSAKYSISSPERSASRWSPVTLVSVATEGSQPTTRCRVRSIPCSVARSRRSASAFRSGSQTRTVHVAPSSVHASERPSTAATVGENSAAPGSYSNR